MTRDERHRLRNAARRLMKDMRRGKEKPASAYDPQIKNFGKHDWFKCIFKYWSSFKRKKERIIIEPSKLFL